MMCIFFFFFYQFFHVFIFERAALDFGRSLIFEITNHIKRKKLYLNNNNNSMHCMQSAGA